MKNIVVMLCVLISTTFSNPVLAQQDTSSFADESIRDISVVAGLGIGGAILGLSTLSFVEEPGDHLKNIVVGAAIGIILGVGVVAMGQASKSKNFYESNASVDFNTSERMKWHKSQEVSPSLQSKNTLSQVGYSFNF